MKTIWFFNHYATNQFLEHNGRHYCFAKYLMRVGYSVRIFCANTVHNSDIVIDAGGDLYTKKSCDGIPFVFVKTRQYKGNGKQRVLNMVDFYVNVQKAAKHFERPDVIIGSSVHPLACVAAIKLGKHYNCRAIAEIRDLWPESIVAYGVKKKTNPIIQFLYRLEKWIYTKADAIIFTMEGGRDYIIEKGWDRQTHGGPVDLDKVHHINNGVDLEQFDYNREHYTFVDPDLDDTDTKKIIYTGSIRKANSSIQILPDVARCLIRKGLNAKILIYGKGDYLGVMQQKCKDEQLENIIFKGSVHKKFIPYVLSKSDLNILNCDSSEMSKYGSSQNKLFEYLASGKPILSGESDQYSLIRRYGCGISKHFNSAQEIAESMTEILRGDVTIADPRILAQDYDFRVLTGSLVDFIGGSHGKHHFDTRSSYR